jgi:ABC-type amino acid transport substrate-binding protein
MASKAASISTNRVGKARKPMPVTAFRAAHQLSAHEIAQVSRALEEKGIKGLRATKVLLATPANHLRELDQEPAPASIVENDGPVGVGIDSADALASALDAARTRGAALKDEMLSDPEMLSTAGLAERLGMSEEGVRLKRRRHEVLGVEVAKRGIRYPAWQVLPGRQILPGLPRLFAVLGDDPWRLLRFLQQNQAELRGQRAFEALQKGQVDEVLAAAENAAMGVFA